MASNGIELVKSVKLYTLDNFTGADQVKTLVGSQGDDIVNIGPVNSAPAQTVNSAATQQVSTIFVSTGDGNDTVNAMKSTVGVMVSAGDGKDWIDGSAFNDYIDAGDGNDVVYAGAGDDTVFGGKGSDYLSGGQGNDTVKGGGDRDFIEGGAGNDALWGNDSSGLDDNARDNFIYRIDQSIKSTDVNLGALWGSDTINDFHAHSNDSNGDVIEMNDFFMRLSDADVTSILNAVSSIIKKNSDGDYVTKGGVLYGDGEDDTTLSNAIIFKDAFNKQGKMTAESPIGIKNASDESIYEMNGLDGAHYRVSVRADYNSEKNDFTVTLDLKNLDNVNDTGARIEIDHVGMLDAQSAFTRETMKLIHGTDKAETYDLSSAAYQAALQGKGANFFGFGGGDTVWGTATDDRLNGNLGDDTLHGNAGNDRLYGDAGNDKLYGDAGNDYLSGGSGNDILDGGANDDQLWGGAGLNFLIGGSGKDQFYFSSGKVVNNKGTLFVPMDTTKTAIVDFEYDTDKIRLGEVFTDYRVSDTALQKQKYVDWLKDHIALQDVSGGEHLTCAVPGAYTTDGKKDLVIYLGTPTEKNALDNAIVVNGNDTFDAEAIVNQLKAGNTQMIDKLFVFG